MGEHLAEIHQGAKFVPANGLDIFCRIDGDPAAAPLVLLHGGTATGAMWDDHLPLFMEHFHVIRPDSRGHGRTFNPADRLGYKMMADDMAALIRALGLERPLVFGHSDGGQIALELAMGHPGLARAIVVGAAAYKLSDYYRKGLSASVFASPTAPDIDGIRQHLPPVAERWKGWHGRPEDPEHWQTVLRWVSAMAWSLDEYTSEELGRIADPMLILTGDRDEYMDVEQQLELFRKVPGSELGIVPAVTHLSALAPGGPYMEVARAFLLKQIIPSG